MLAPAVVFGIVAGCLTGFFVILCCVAALCCRKSKYDDEWVKYGKLRCPPGPTDIEERRPLASAPENVDAEKLPLATANNNEDVVSPSAPPPHDIDDLEMGPAAGPSAPSAASLPLLRRDTLERRAAVNQEVPPDYVVAVEDETRQPAETLDTVDGKLKETEDDKPDSAPSTPLPVVVHQPASSEPHNDKYSDEKPVTNPDTDSVVDPPAEAAEVVKDEPLQKKAENRPDGDVTDKVVIANAHDSESKAEKDQVQGNAAGSKETPETNDTAEELAAKKDTATVNTEPNTAENKDTAVNVNADTTEDTDTAVKCMSDNLENKDSDNKDVRDKTISLSSTSSSEASEDCNLDVEDESLDDEMHKSATLPLQSRAYATTDLVENEVTEKEQEVTDKPTSSDSDSDNTKVQTPPLSPERKADHNMPTTGSADVEGGKLTDDKEGTEEPADGESEGPEKEAGVQEDVEVGEIVRQPSVIVQPSVDEHSSEEEEEQAPPAQAQRSVAPIASFEEEDDDDDLDTDDDGSNTSPRHTTPEHSAATPQPHGQLKTPSSTDSSPEGGSKSKHVRFVDENEEDIVIAPKEHVNAEEIEAPNESAKATRPPEETQV